MRAAILTRAGDVRVEDVPEPSISRATDAIVRIVRSCICGSDLHYYHNHRAEAGKRMIGHEFVGIVDAIGSEVRRISVGDFVIAPFVWSCGECEFCLAGLQTSCVRGGFWASRGVGGGQAEAVTVPLADSTLVPVPGIDESSPLLPSLLTLSDVYGTGHHAASRAQVSAGDSVVVIGDGAVGLLSVLAAKRLGAERIVLMGHHEQRLALGREFGASEVVAARGEEGVALVRELSEGGYGFSKVIEAVGLRPAYEQAFGIVRPGGIISRVGAPQYEEAPIGFRSLFGANITLTGGPAPVRAYIEELLPEVLDGTVNPGRVFDLTVDIEGIPDGYRAMDERRALKVLIQP